MRSYRLVILFMVLVIANARVEAQTQREEAVASTVDATLIGRQVANEVIRDYVNEMRSIAVYEACGHKDLAAPLRDKFKPDWRRLAERTHQIKAGQIATILLYANDLQLWECRDGEPDEWIQRCRARLARCRSTRQSLLRAGEATEILAVTRAREKLALARSGHGLVSSNGGATEGHATLSRSTCTMQCRHSPLVRKLILALHLVTTAGMGAPGAPK